HVRSAEKEEQEEPQREVRKETKRAKASAEYTTYTIKKDESLWTISKKVHGISSKEILRFNGINDPKHLKPGVKIKIPKD
ncbi:MAG: LysM domain-containing protein, partial [Bacteroidota bacterium]|nr:LysM domain-containing protein [Bacteroidota bacterium]